MLYNAKLDKLLYETIEAYLIGRLTIASSVSTSAFHAELANVKQTIDDLARTEQRSIRSYELSGQLVAGVGNRAMSYKQNLRAEASVYYLT
jgi:hypothetical protein